jgi:hypothetical protein
MSKKQQEWLTEQLINDISLENTENLYKNISGMTTNEIMEALEKATLIRTRLNETNVGRELN